MSDLTAKGIKGIYNSENTAEKKVLVEFMDHNRLKKKNFWTFMKILVLKE